MKRIRYREDADLHGFFYLFYFMTKRKIRFYPRFYEVNPFHPRSIIFTTS
ncbi:hypothetical protein SAMN05216297_109133 [Flavobacterium phragmitis]|uniref:Uncharacterized protein n=1 Tax=Flavobacterium phragmitis TaxID=739143 RepID=A0A1I1TEY2_9FLAO|nr:hypothetical protein SAMN05216297_109133 [Flavobacterium phragmitis]